MKSNIFKDYKKYYKLVALTRKKTESKLLVITCPSDELLRWKVFIQDVDMIGHEVNYYKPRVKIIVDDSQNTSFKYIPYEIKPTT